MKKNIAIYQDLGVGDFSLFSARHFFKNHYVTTLSSKDIISGVLTDEIDIFVMPGGADIPYCEKLNGKGNKAIRHYVEQGGLYLGLCAGAYYGCAAIEFQKDTATGICDKRELGFFDGTGIGCLPDLTGERYKGDDSKAIMTDILIKGESYRCYYSGGCYFKPDNDSYIEIARYENLDNNPLAIIEQKIGKGRALLSGVHFEVDSSCLSRYEFDNRFEQRQAVQLRNDLERADKSLNDYMREYLDV